MLILYIHTHRHEIFYFFFSSKSFARLSKRCSASEGSASLLDLTPSPSESTMLSEMETVLRDRDRELRHLRQTMEHNEQVIFRVYQEKENAWDREMRRIKAMGENRLKTAAQKSLKLEQMLMMQTYKVNISIKVFNIFVCKIIILLYRLMYNIYLIILYISCRMKKRNYKKKTSVWNPRRRI